MRSNHTSHGPMTGGPAYFPPMTFGGLRRHFAFFESDGGGSGTGGGAGDGGGAQDGGQGGSGAGAQGGQGGDQTDWKKKHDDLAANFRKLEGKLTNFEKAQKEREDAEKTEAQKERERAEKAEQDAIAARREAIGAKYGLAESLWERIKGTTKEEMEEDAKGLAELFKVDAKPGHTGGEPKDKKPPEAKTKADELKAQLAEAVKNKDEMAVMRIERQIQALNSK